MTGPVRNRLLERDLAGDARWALAVLAGVVLAVLILPGADAWTLCGAAVGVVVVLVALSVLRARRRP
jgi:type IV secretory pathway TrbD component